MSPPSMVDNSPVPSPAVLSRAQAAAIDIRVRLHCELSVMNRKEQLEVLYAIGTYVATRLEKIAPPARG